MMGRILLVWLISRLVLLGIGLLAGPADTPWSMWSRWNSAHYLEIAETGYRAGYLGPAGWLPLYPWLSLPGQAWLGSQASLVLTANFALLLALWLLDQLYRDEPQSQAGLWLLLAFPSAFLFSCVTSESTFLLFAAASFLAARRGWWRTACLLASAATLTRLAGLTLLPALLFERRPEQKRVWLLAAPLAFGLYCLHLQKTTGDLWAYFRVQEVVHQKFGVAAFLLQGRSLWPEHKLGLIFLLLQLAMLALSWPHLRRSERAYLVASLAMNLYHTQGLGTQRLMLVVFPLYWGVARATQARPRLQALLLTLGALLQGWMFALWVEGSRATY